MLRFTITALALFILNFSLMAQSKSGYEIIETDNKQEVIYKGPCTFEDIANVAAFKLQENAAAYQPAGEQTQALSKVLPEFDMIIFLGTWCEDSHNLIPKLYKVLQETGYPLDKPDIQALDRDKKGLHEVQDQFKITNVPTIILLQNGVETGRITETVKKSIEQDLLDITATP